MTIHANSFVLNIHKVARNFKPEALLKSFVKRKEFAFSAGQSRELLAQKVCWKLGWK